jgi:hypothetical protein
MIIALSVIGYLGISLLVSILFVRFTHRHCVGEVILLSCLWPFWIPMFLLFYPWYKLLEYISN